MEHMDTLQLKAPVNEQLLPVVQEYDCCVPGCNSNQVNNTKLYFHPLPSDTRLRELWLETCNIVERDPDITETFRVCGKHFDSSQYLQNYQLLQGSIPKIIPNRTKLSDSKSNTKTISNNVVINNAAPALNMLTLNKEVRERINDSKVQKFNVSLRNDKLSHLLLVLDQYKTTLDQSESKPIVYYPVDPILNEKLFDTIDVSTLPIPNVTQTPEETYPVVINKITSTGEEITMTIKSSKRKQQLQIPRYITYDFTQVCRICLENGDLKHVYEEMIDEICVNELLERYTSFMMLKNSNLPPQICTKCLVNLKQTHEFFKKVDRSCTIYQNRLRSQLLDQSDLLTYKEKYFTPLQIPENTENLEAPDMQEEEIHKIPEETSESIIENNGNKVVIDLEPIRTIEDIMDTGFNDMVNETIPMNADEFICLKCEESYENFLLLSKHICVFTPEPAAILTDYTCKFCKTMFKTYNKFSTHLCYVKKGKQLTDSPTVRKEFKCQVCNEVFLSNSLFLYHRKLYKHNVAHYCYECDVNFVTRIAFRRHKTTFQHKNEKKCEICKRFVKITKYASHVAEHIPFFSCKICGKYFVTEFKYNKHLELHKTVPVNPSINLPKPAPNQFKLNIIKMYLNK